MVYVSVIYAGK